MSDPESRVVCVAAVDSREAAGSIPLDSRWPGQCPQTIPPLFLLFVLPFDVFFRFRFFTALSGLWAFGLPPAGFPLQLLIFSSVPSGLGLFFPLCRDYNTHFQISSFQLSQSSRARWPPRAGSPGSVSYFASASADRPGRTLTHEAQTGGPSFFTRI